MNAGYDIHPFIRFLDNRELSIRYSRRQRQDILYAYVQYFCEFYSDGGRNKDSDIDKVIDKFKLNRTLTDGQIWAETLDRVHDMLRSALSRNGQQLPVDGVLVVDFDRGFAFFNELDDGVGSVSPTELMSTLQKWLKDQEDNGTYVPQQTHTLIEQFINEVGWLR